MAVAKSDGRIRLTCNYNNIDEQSIIQIFPLPGVYDILSELGNSRIFNTTDLINEFFQCAINKEYFPLAAVCTQDGLWKWTVMSQGFASSSVWCQSIMLRVCEGLERVKLSIDDIVASPRTGNSMYATCDGSSIGQRDLTPNLHLIRHC